MSTLTFKASRMNMRKDDVLRLEEEHQKMEEKIQMLRKAMDGGGYARSSAGDAGARWRGSNAKKSFRPDAVRSGPDTKKGLSALVKQPRSEGGVLAKDVLPLTGARGGSPRRVPSGRTTPSAEAQASVTSALAADMSPHVATSAAAAAAASAVRPQLSRDALEVESFLAGLGLDRYVSIFMDHGFDCMEVVNLMQEEHMREIGVATGHAIKLKRRLAELNPPPEPAPVAPSQSASSTQKRVNFGETSEIRPGSGVGTGTTAVGSLLDGSFDEAAEKASFQEAVRAWREGRTADATKSEAQQDSLLDGEFDEEESRSGFQEAVKAWREGRQASESAPSKAAAAAPRPSLGSFWSKIGGDEVNLERCSTPLTAPTDSALLQNEPAYDPAPSERKLCCYQCYKQYYAKFTVERCSPLPDRTMRRFCSDACSDVWMASMQAKADELFNRQEKMAQLDEAMRAADYQKTSEIKQSQSDPPVQA